MKTLYICQNCQRETPKWTGKCPNCNEWNTLSEETISIQKKSARSAIRRHERALPLSLSGIIFNEKRITTGIAECDRVLGGGIVPGNLIVLSGEPGIGKSTLALQMIHGIAESLTANSAEILASAKTQIPAKNSSTTRKPKLFYISGEESVSQIALRAKRMGVSENSLLILNETNLETILATLDHEKPDFVIIDSIQVVASDDIPSQSGSINQVRYATEKLMEWGKKTLVPILIIGHVNKDGMLAGPKVFEHLVDTVLFFEGNRYQQFRMLRSLKNRFGSTNEVGLFEMTEKGLREVLNASESFLTGRKKGAFGSVVTATVEGARPFLVEVQALTNTTVFGYPKRTASGFDVKRLELLLAVLQKHAGLNLLNQDVYVNVVGGLSLEEPAADLSVCLAVTSSYKKTALSENLCAIGEIGLSGELRAVPQMEKRVKEAEKLGFHTIMMPSTRETVKTKARLIVCRDIREALALSS